MGSDDIAYVTRGVSSTSIMNIHKPPTVHSFKMCYIKHKIENSYMLLVELVGCRRGTAIHRGCIAKCLFVVKK